MSENERAMIEAVAQTQLAIMDRLDAQKDVLDAILKALNAERPPSPVAAVMQEIAATLREQTELLRKSSGYEAEGATP